MHPSSRTRSGAVVVSIALTVLLAACGATNTSFSPSASGERTSSASTASPTVAATQPGPPASADDWPFFRGNAARTGEGGSGPKGNPVEVWKYNAGGSINSAVVIADDLVYATSDDDILHALDIETGTERWHFNPVNSPVSAPAYADGVIYAFDGAGTLFGLDANTGAVRWHAPKPFVGPSDPTISGGTVYVGTGDGAIVAIDAIEWSEQWRYQVSPTGSVHRPAFADGVVYAASDSGGLVGLDVATHEKVL